MLVVRAQTLPFYFYFSHANARSRHRGGLGLGLSLSPSRLCFPLSPRTTCEFHSSRAALGDVRNRRIQAASFTAAIHILSLLLLLFVVVSFLPACLARNVYRSTKRERGGYIAVDFLPVSCVIIATCFDLSLFYFPLRRCSRTGAQVPLCFRRPTRAVRGLALRCASEECGSASRRKRGWASGARYFLL